ncbi:enoyl-CoA hydratase [Gordonia terrae]|uniref:enoyl-CoA hydratase n=1 Tax=Gordonia terrae TaxID=2055 RepID=UPI003F6BA1AB
MADDRVAAPGEPLLLIEQSGRVRTLVLNRPDVRNALSSGLIDALRSEVANAGRDDDVDVVILTGAGSAFCAGLDLAELGSSTESARLLDHADVPVGHPWRPISKPIIGAVNGVAATGGLEIALACDVLIASERARFVDTHSRVGVLPGWGLTSRLPEAVGRGFARRMSLSGEFVDAQTALRVGLVTEVVAHDQLMDSAMDLAMSIAGSDQLAVRTMLESYRRAEQHLVDPALDAENSTSVEWMAGFDPARVAGRRSDIVERGRANS